MLALIQASMSTETSIDIPGLGIGLVPKRCQTIIWTIVDKDPQYHRMPLGHNGLISVLLQKLLKIDFESKSNQYLGSVFRRYFHWI